jgi:hypothetical protein
MPSMMIAVSPNTLWKSLRSCELNALIWVSMSAWISGGGLLVTVRLE